MKKKLIVVLSLAVILAFCGCQTKGLVYTKYYSEQGRAYMSVTGGKKTDYIKVKLPDAYDAAYVEAIGEAAFLDCRSLVEINIPPHITLIGGQAFKNCESLPKISLPLSLESIGAEAFAGCTSLTGITLPDNVVDINIQAFQNCTGLKSVIMPAFAKDVTDRVFLETISERVFSGCFRLEFIALSGGIKKISLSAFENCLTLKNVEFPAGLEIIGDRAYSGCVSIEKIELAAGLKSVGYYAFFGCTSLSEVIINDGTSEDGEDFIGDGAFGGCPIKSLTILRAEVINFAAFDFDLSDSDSLTGLEIRVLPQVYQDYLSDSDWSGLADYISVIAE